MNKNNFKKFLNKVDVVLWKDWDPIGVNDSPEARDEYCNYVYPICKKIVDNSSEQEILDYMFYIESDLMGGTGNKKEIYERNKDVLKKIINLYKE